MDTSKPLIVDSHLDLGFSALQINRDLTLPAASVRVQDPVETQQSYGSCTVTLPDLRRGRVGIVCATVMSRLDPDDRSTRTGMYSQTQCHGVGRGHLAYYQALEQQGHVRILHECSELDQMAALWQRAEVGADGSGPPVGVVLSMESADPILGPDQVPQWHALGLRMVSLSHYGTSTYSHGTATEGGLLPPAADLLKALAEAGILVDVTHLTDQAHWELLDIYDGPICASHHNCRALTPGQRQLTDDMISSIAERDGVIGTAFDSWMLDPGWQRNLSAGEQQSGATLQTIVEHVDHIAQLTGTSRHCGIGTDLDGGFGTEQAPRDLNTIADLQSLPALLLAKGFSDEDVSGILSGNWLRLLGQHWKDSL
jgi:membrane dipeptidase